MPFNTRDAREIAAKLGATIVPRTDHDLVQFWYCGKLIGAYGIRRGSKPSLSHDFIPNQLRISPNLCKRFQVCTVDLVALVAELKKRGLIPADCP